MFLGELNRISFTSSSMAEFVISHGGKEIFSNTYYPDDTGTITIYDVASILEPYIKDVYADFTFSIDGAVIGSPRVFYCAWSITSRAMNFLDASFLTPMQGARRTHTARYETLTVYAASPAAVTAECVYYGDAGISRRTVAIATASGLAVLDVSPRKFVNASMGQLVEYTVVCGARRAKYQVMPTMPDLSDAFIFRNAFGAWDTLYMTGTRETEPTYTRSTANINGYIRSYQIQEVISQKTYTGPLPAGMEWVAMSLANSKAVFFLLDNGDSGDEVHVTDCDLKHTNDNTSESNLNFSYRNATITWQLADDRVARLDVPRPPRIFDDTFDRTYE